MRNKGKNRKAFIGLVLALAILVATAVPVAYAAYIKYADNVVAANTMGKQEANVDQNTVNFGLDVAVRDGVWKALSSKTNPENISKFHSTYTPEKSGWYLVTLQGAFGQRGRTDTSANVGAGGLISAYVWFEAGEEIYVTVGGRVGGNAWDNDAKNNQGGYLGNTGFNGGGFGGSFYHYFPSGWSTEYWFNEGGAGGGATDIRVGGTAIENRIMVSGGGGGSGGKGDKNDFKSESFAGGNGGMGENLQYVENAQANVTLAGNIKKDIIVSGYVSNGSNGAGETSGAKYSYGSGGGVIAGGAAADYNYGYSSTDPEKLNATATQPEITPLNFDMGGDVLLQHRDRSGTGAFSQGGSAGTHWRRAGAGSGGAVPKSMEVGTGAGGGGGGWFGGGAGAGIGRTLNRTGGGGGGSSFIIGNHNALDTVAIKNSSFRTLADRNSSTSASGLVLAGIAPKTHPSDLQEGRVYSYSKTSEGGTRTATYWGHEGFATFSYMGEVLPYIDPVTIVAK